MAKILKTYKNTAPYIDLVCQYGDENRKELGFLPRFAYEDQAVQDRLWVAKYEGEYAGHLMFGGRFPTLKVYQMFVHKDYRGKGIARRMLGTLEEYGEKNDYLSIGARVAEDLDANIFWEKMGFELIKTKPGGKTTKRTINIRSKTLNTPSLLSLIENSHKNDKNKSVIYVDKPILKNNQYAIDLNVLFDVLKPGRDHRNESCSIIRAGLANKVRLCVTEEFSKELERNSKYFDSDPVLMFAKQLPTLDSVKDEDTKDLEHELRLLVFPDRSAERKGFEQDQSDLRHLAQSIVSGVDGFVTREKAILRSKDKIKARYSLQILPPSDFLESQDYDEGVGREISSQSLNENILFSEAKYSDTTAVEAFLIERGVNAGVATDILKAGASGSSRRRWIVRVGGQLVAVAAWDVPSKVSKETVLWVYADEEHHSFEIITDHIFESMFRDNYTCRARKIILRVAAGQDRTKHIAIQRGFRGFGRGENDQLMKISFAGVITPPNWGSFREDFKSLTGLILPAKMPDGNGGKNNLLILKDDSNDRSYELSCFDLETLISPAILLCPGRDGIMIPIKPQFAKGLGIISSKQLNLLPENEALLHPEKAYFRSKNGATKFKKGMPIVFYVSRDKRDEIKAAVGLGRVTYTNIHTVKEIRNKFSRQGVLPEPSLLNIADNNEKLHVFTFDNFNKFQNYIPYKTLKNESIISAANLTSVEFKPSEVLMKMVNEETAFGV